MSSPKALSNQVMYQSISTQYFTAKKQKENMLLRDGSYYEVCKIAGNENNSFPTLWKKIDFRKKWSKKLFGCATFMKEKVVLDIFLVKMKYFTFFKSVQE